MTRRERHLYIIGSWGSLRDRHVRWHFDLLISRRGFAALTDEAVEELARDLIADRNFQKKLNERNRKAREAQELKATNV